MPSTRSGGEALANNTVAAPTLIGNSSSPPSPKVKASGGGAVNRASAVARRTWGGKKKPAAQPEGEGRRRAADEQVVGRGAQHMRRKTDAGRHHVAVEVHGGLGASGGARGEGQQADVVGGGVDGGEAVGLARG